MENNIDVRNKDEKEILNIYKKIASESIVQEEIYDEVNNKEIANKIYGLYKIRKREKENEVSRNK